MLWDNPETGPPTCKSVIMCYNNNMRRPRLGGIGGTMARESALRSAETLLSRVRAPPSASRPTEGPKA
ncbi:hypothetical protein PoB_002120300 [Plakobranchus ocellatus]|uniref:DRBM domain-containing protein n=1 Tax=Plakobranchus ocellatus TaxID=259542 RepID=A0AAV3ZIR8_9GAST|nr:hypothetical protein PoB_002120300 [Plakobranchus ocellatus]